MWSACPWVSRIACGLSSSAATAALGLPVKNGSISTVLDPSLSSKAAWPRKRMSIVVVLLSSGSGWTGLRARRRRGTVALFDNDKSVCGEAAERLPAQALPMTRVERPQPRSSAHNSDRGPTTDSGVERPTTLVERLQRRPVVGQAQAETQDQ